MEHLTQEYLESIGFHLGWSHDHAYRAQFTKYDSGVTRAIILLSQTDLVKSVTVTEDTIFDVWFWGQTPTGAYSEVDSHMSISTKKELETILSYLRD